MWDGDGQVTTYDAYCILDALEIQAIVLPAGASVEVTAEIVLPETAKASLDQQYKNGAYIEGYLYVEPVSTDEGEAAPVHSIPVLGFYGNWTTPSMYDRITYTDYLYGDTTAPYLGYTQTNNLIIKHRGRCKRLLPGGKSLPDRGDLPARKGSHPFPATPCISTGCPDPKCWRR